VQPGAHGFEGLESALQLGQQLAGRGGVHLVLDGDVGLELLLVLGSEVGGKGRLEPTVQGAQLVVLEVEGHAAAQRAQAGYL
jgi:hypothetical protein